MKSLPGENLSGAIEDSICFRVEFCLNQLYPKVNLPELEKLADQVTATMTGHTKKAYNDTYHKWEKIIFSELNIKLPIYKPNDPNNFSNYTQCYVEAMEQVFKLKTLGTKKNILGTLTKSLQLRCILRERFVRKGDIDSEHLVVILYNIALQGAIMASIAFEVELLEYRTFPHTSSISYLYGFGFEKLELEKLFKI